MSFQELVLRVDMARGRKRRYAERERSGRLTRRGVDRGTSKLQSLREWYAGKGDPAKGTYPLGILLANGLINEQMHMAGRHYAWLHSVVYGRHSIGAASYELCSPSVEPLPSREEEKEEERAEVKLRQVRAALDRGGLRGLDDLVVYERKPHWMRPIMRTVYDKRNQDRLLASLKALTRAMGAPTWR